MSFPPPPVWQTQLLAYVRRTFPTKAYSQGKISDTAAMTLAEARFYGKGLRPLSDHFNGIAPIAASNYFNLKEYRAAYLLYFFAANWAKMTDILQQTARHLPILPSYRLLDLGSGPGSMSLAAIDGLQNHLKATHAPAATVHLDWVDQSRSALADAQGLSRQLFTDQTITSRLLVDRASPRTFLQLGKDPYDLIILGDMLNELDMPARFDLVERCLTSKLAPHGSLIVVEPALQKTARDLQHLRDRLVKEIPTTRILAPCLRQGLCPLNHYNRRDWCHFYSAWQRPAWLDMLENTAGLRKDWLKYAYLVFQNTAQPRTRPQPTPHARTTTWRVISNPMKGKGTQELVLCGPQGRLHLTGHFQNKSLKNGDFFNLRRGDPVAIVPTEWRDLCERAEGWDYRLVLTPDHTIARIDA